MIIMIERLEYLKKITKKIRYKLIKMSNMANTGHLAGALSCVDLLVALYWEILNIDPNNSYKYDRDRLIFSKGHAISALYTVLALRGFFDESILENYNQPSFGLPEQPCPNMTPGVEWATGSLGHGLSVGLGMALASKIKNVTFSTYVLMSDGECQEGSVWEAAMLAPKLPISPLTVIIDFNGWQATGRTIDVMQMEPLHRKWNAFGWEAITIDGHNLLEILNALKLGSNGRPKAIIAKTVKGKGVSFMEDDNNWHYRSPSQKEVEMAALELGIE